MPIPDMDWPYQLMLQAFWLLPFLLGVFMLRGGNQNWIAGRARIRGWYAWFLAIFAGGFGLLVNYQYLFRWFDRIEAPELAYQLVAGFILFVPWPLAFLALFVGVPRFMQPRWIKERLAAGDPVEIPDLPRELWGTIPSARDHAAQEAIARQQKAEEEAAWQELVARHHARHAAAMADLKQRRADEARAASEAPSSHRFGLFGRK